MSFKSPLRGLPAFRASRDAAMGSTPAFVPTDLTGLTLWIKADVGTFQDNLYTVPAVADGDPVGGWQDQSGNVNHARQAAAANKPTLKLNIQNGLPVIRFDGTNDYLDLGVTISDQYTTWFFVSKRTAGASRTILGHTQNARNYLDEALTAPMRVVDNASAIRTWIGTAFGAFDILSFVARNTETEMYLNGGTMGVKAALNDVLNTSVIGDANPVNRPLSGDIAEMLNYDSPLSDADRQRVEVYLSARWGIALV